MIRHEAIAILSRDHHQALMQAIALKRVDDDSAGGVAADFVTWFDADCERHFEVEEQVLLPLYALYVGLESAVDPVIGQMLREHVELRALVESLRRGEQSVAHVREVGHRLDAHVRLEERKLFPRIQERLSDEELTALAAAVEVAEAG